MGAESIDVLLVDDSADDTAFVLHALGTSGLTPITRTAQDGADALDLLFGGEGSETGALRLLPRLIILDLKLPKVDGLEVLRRLKSNPQGRSVPVVVWSSSLEKRDLTTSYELGVNSYLVKPMDAGEFTRSVQEMVRYWLNRNRVSWS